MTRPHPPTAPNTAALRKEGTHSLWEHTQATAGSVGCLGPVLTGPTPALLFQWGGAVSGILISSPTIYTMVIHSGSAS